MSINWEIQIDLTHMLIMEYENQLEILELKIEHYENMLIEYKTRRNALQYNISALETMGAAIRQNIDG